MRDDPADALFELDELIARMMEARGLPLRERDGEVETEPGDGARVHRGAPRHASSRRRRGRRSGDIAYAINSYRELYKLLLDRSP